MEQTSDHLAETADPILGAVLHGSYRIVRKIGDGGMGSVYEATHVRLTKKRFAVKILNPALASTEVYARFRREAEITTELGHPNIVDVTDFNVTADGKPYMVMEYLDGQDLGSYLQTAGVLQPSAVARVIEQVGGALQAVHLHGIVHRDMKPENIFLLAPLHELRVKVLDFGISKIRDSKTVLTQHNAVFGTPYYMSPEQAEGAVADIDHTTDIFALGAICYQALSGALPFDAPTIPGVLYRVCHVEPEPITDVVPGLPEELNEVLGRAMAKKKDQRYQHIDDFIKEVTAVLLDAGAVGPSTRKRETADAPSGHAASPTRTTLSEAAGEQGDTLPPSSGRRWAMVGALAFGLVTILTVTGILVLGGGDDGNGQHAAGGAAIDAQTAGAEARVGGTVTTDEPDASAADTADVGNAAATGATRDAQVTQPSETTKPKTARPKTARPKTTRPNTTKPRTTKPRTTKNLQFDDL